MVDFESNIGLVYAAYNRRFSGFPQLEEDILQEGMIGLWNACQTFDESRGVAFSTYATACIIRAMAGFLRKEMPHSTHLLSLDALIDPEQSTDTFAELIGEDLTAEQARKILFEDVVRILQQTPAWHIVELKLQGKSQAAIAKQLGMSEPYVSEQLSAAYAEVRKKLGDNALEGIF